MGAFKKSSHDFIAGAFFLIFVPILAHWAFSWIGFSLTYEGLNLSFSRRILDGQIPHRDFINIRPIGSALLHAPFVAFGGSHVFWICRLFVWFEFACIAWMWTSVILQSLEISLPVFQKYLLAAIALMFTTHTFPMTAWHTVDGFFFLSVGLALCLAESPSTKLLGYSFMGMAYLCKQSFLLIFPALLFALGDWRRWRFWLAAAIPGLVYWAYLFFNKAIPDAVIQLGSHANAFFSQGVRRYLQGSGVSWGILLGLFSAYSLFGQDRIRQKILGVMVLSGLLLAFSVALSQHRMAPLFLSFVLFGTLLGFTGYFIFSRKTETSFRRIGLLTLLAGWGASLSLTYQYPVLAAGPFAVLLIAFCYRSFKPLGNEGNRSARKFSFLFLIIFFSITLLSYATARRKYVHDDPQSTPELTQDLKDLLIGGDSIKINPKVGRFLSDFNKARTMTGGLDFAILPGLPAYWVKSKQKNPLCIDWAIRDEVSHNKALADRVIADLEIHRGKIAVILMKECAAQLKRGLIELPTNKTYRYVRDHFTKTGETDFFELYR